MVKILLGTSIILILFALLAGCTTPPPEADFIASVTYGNVPITIQFTDQSTGNVQAWAWDFNNDQLIDSTAQHPQFTYTKPGTYTVILRAQGSGGTDIETKEAYIVLTPPANTISGVSPSSGDRGLTMDVIILSSSATFSGVSTVSFGSEIAVNNFTADSPSQMTANITIDVYAAAGPRDVLVTTSTGTAALSGGFTVIIPPAPTIAALNPSSGDQAATLSVSITGAGFRMATAIDFGDGIAVNDYVINSTNQITADISIEPDAAAAPRDVLVGNPGGNTTLNQGFLVTVPPPPVVTGASPAFASRGETLDVVITGTGFNGATEVLFRSGLGVNVNSFTIDSPTQATANISVSASATLGTRDCSITTPGGSGTLTAGFEVVGVTPSFGSRGDTLNVVITGTGFDEASAVSFGDGIIVNSFVIDSSTQLAATITIAVDAVPGPREILITISGDERHAGSFSVSTPTCKANFTADKTSGSGITTVQFTDGSTGDITSWKWDLNGDGVIDSLAQNPSYTYKHNGSYTVTLTISGPYCNNTLTRTGYIKIAGCST